MKKTILSLLLMVACMSICAKSITANEAINRMHGDNFSITETCPVYTSTGYYAFDRADGGFVLLSTNDDMPAVLGYTDSGSFCYERINPNMRWYLGLMDLCASRVAEPQHLQAAAVKPLLGNIAWDQYEPFNRQTPEYYEDEHMATGCVATAMAQVMRYWKWPAKGKGSISYTYYVEVESGVYDEEQSVNEANFSQHTYDWANMLEYYDYDFETGNYTYSEKQGDAVALLMADCGAAAKMEYGTDDAGGSAAMTDDAMNGMIQYFDYASDMQYVLAENYSAADWDQLIYHELAVGRPVILGGNGQDGSGGHEFVCDGFTDGLFHINWGWSGSDNGYFALTGAGLVPGSSGSGGAGDNASYGYGLEAVIRIRPNNGTAISNVTAKTEPAQVFDIFGRAADAAHTGILITRGSKAVRL